ncbi:hypothetical protein, unlikely [Trypanosoma congolense IL3000]|uniref:Uncharacterized protein n=1 Tax=Trypanosoma congolense (strain IL3000) TaxID=1068625 RepID=F9W8K7_TRYCI|nr:hypothetical protein, unlikely [Trypanosoma congolense IL3000]
MRSSIESDNAEIGVPKSSPVGNSVVSKTPVSRECSMAQLRLDVSELSAHLGRLEETYKILNSAQLCRQEEFEDEVGALHRAYAAATSGVKSYRSALQDTIRRAEEILGDCHKRGDSSLANRLASGLAEARAVLRLHANGGLASRSGVAT